MPHLVVRRHAAQRLVPIERHASVFKQLHAIEVVSARNESVKQGKVSIALVTVRKQQFLSLLDVPRRSHGKFAIFQRPIRVDFVRRARVIDQIRRRHHGASRRSSVAFIFDSKRPRVHERHRPPPFILTQRVIERLFLLKRRLDLLRERRRLSPALVVVQTRGDNFDTFWIVRESYRRRTERR